MRKRKAILYFSNTISLSNIGFNADYFSLDVTNLVESYTNDDQSGEVYLIFDGLNKREFEDKVWGNIKGAELGAFGFVYHSKPDTELVDFLVDQRNCIASFKGRHDIGSEKKVQYYTEIRGLINGVVLLTAEFFQSLWNKYDTTATLQTHLDQLHQAWAGLDRFDTDALKKLAFKRDQLLTQ